MADISSNIDIFKPYLQVNNPYKGGKTLAEIKSATQKVYKLSSNENPLGCSPKALEAIKKASADLHRYPDRTDARIQEALATFYKGQLDPDQFLVANSGSETIELIIRAFLGEGLECIISNPTFLVYQMFTKWQGSKVVDIRLNEPDYSLNIDGIMHAITDKTRLIFLTSPNNPTGTYIPKQDIDNLISLLPDHVILVLDEVYYNFAEAADYTTALPYVLAGKNVIGINSFSKTYGLAAMRVGYFYTTKKISNYIHQVCKPFILNKLSLEAGIAALQDTEFVDQTVALVKKERAYLQNEIEQLGLQYWKSQGNFVMIKPPMTPKEFESKMLEEGVMVRPVESFGAPGCVRITIGQREANEAAVKAMKKILS